MPNSSHTATSGMSAALARSPPLQNTSGITARSAATTLRSGSFSMCSVIKTLSTLIDPRQNIADGIFRLDFHAFKILAAVLDAGQDLPYCFIYSFIYSFACSLCFSLYFLQLIVFCSRVRVFFFSSSSVVIGISLNGTGIFLLVVIVYTDILLYI